MLPRQRRQQQQAGAHSAVHPAGCGCNACGSCTAALLPPARHSIATVYKPPSWRPSAPSTRLGAVHLQVPLGRLLAVLVRIVQLRRRVGGHLLPLATGAARQVPEEPRGRLQQGRERVAALRWRQRRRLGGGSVVAGPGPCACCDQPSVISSARQDRPKARSCPPLTCWPWGVAAAGVAAAPPPPVSQPHMLLASAGSGAAQKPASQPPDLNGATDAPARSDHGGGRVGEGSDRFLLRRTCMGRRRPLPPLRSKSGSPSSLYYNCCSSSAESV